MRKCGGKLYVLLAVALVWPAFLAGIVLIQLGKHRYVGDFLFALGMLKATGVINTAVLIWFIPQIETLVCLIIKPRKADEEDEFRLQYIRGGLMKTPELSVFQAQKEIAVFGEKMQRMFGLVKELYVTQDAKAFDALFDRIRKGEEMSDQMENEIGKYLGAVGDAHLSDDTKDKIRRMLRCISELESLGDSNFNMARILKRKRDQKIVFNNQLEAVDHWVAFGLLFIIGVEMIADAFKKGEEKTIDPYTLRSRLVLAVATSIDALAIGISFACTGYSAKTRTHWRSYPDRNWRAYPD